MRSGVVIEGLNSLRASASDLSKISSGTRALTSLYEA